MKTIALVNCCLPQPKEKEIGPPQGSLYLATALTQSGYDVNLYDTVLSTTPESFTPDFLYKYLSAIPEDILCISAWDTTLPKVILATRQLKQLHPQKKIILGGPSSSVTAEDLVNAFGWLDFCVEGEGEAVLTKLIIWIDTGGIDTNKLPDRVVGRNGDDIFRGKFSVNHLVAGDIPIPDYRLVNLSKYNKAEIVSSRGCPYTCSFCSVNNTWGKNVRFRTDDSIISELHSLFSLGNTCVHIMDDNFGTDRGRLYRFMEMFKSDYPGKKWSCYFRLSDMVPNIIDDMADSGCIGLFVGIESGDESKLNELGKLLSRNEIVTRLKYATYRMDITASFVWGFPDETLKQLSRTLGLVNELLDLENIYINLYQLAPLSGTKIQRILSEHLRFDENMISHFVYPPFAAPLTPEEKALIAKHPNIFASYYHEASVEFKQKQQIVNTFLGK